MLDQRQAAPLPLLITDHDMEQRKRMVALDSDDIARLVALKDIVIPRAEQYTEAFFDHLGTIGAAAQLPPRPRSRAAPKR